MATTEAPASAIDATPTVNPVDSADPFASQREGGNDPFEGDKGVGESAISSEEGAKLEDSPGGEKKVRRTSKEWDASKVPPSQFQKRKGSIYATPSSRDHHSGDNERDKAYHEKLKEKGWNLFGKKK